jgi:hypothetical protein
MKTKRANNRKQIKKSASKAQTKKNTSNDKTVRSVENGIKVIKYAIKNKTSVSEAARENGHGRNYVSDIKARIDNNFKNRSITRELYDSFKSHSRSYEKATK